MKKRILSVLLALVMVLGMLPVTAFAEGSDFTIKNGVLTKYKGPGGDVTIPSSVTSIRYEAFKDCTGLTSVTIPNGVTSIGREAFYNCMGLTSVAIPSSVTKIEAAVFCGCTDLTSVTIPYSVTSIGGYAFSKCRSLTRMSIPDSVTNIGWEAFSKCTSLTSVTIPNSVTSTGKWAFSDCTGLTSVIIPNGVTSVDYGTFARCTGLTNVTIPDGVTSIGTSAFLECTGLTSVIIPNSVTSIHQWAFNGCSGLTDIYYSGTVSQWNSIEIRPGNSDLNDATIHYNCSGPGKDNNVSDNSHMPELAETISDEAILRAKLLTVDHSFVFYREWTSPVQIMAEHLDPMPAVTWYTVENLIDMYYQSAKKSNTSSNNIANVTSVEFYEYLLFKLLDSKELGYLSITEPFGLIEEASGERINGALLKKIVSSGFKAGSKIEDENLVDIKNMCISICGTDDIEDIGWLDTILVSGKSIDEFATEFVKLYSLTSVSDARAEAIRMIGENTQIPALRTAAANVYTSIRQAKKEGVDYCLSGGLEASLDNLTTWLLDKMVDKMCDINPTSHIWKAASDSTTFVMDTIFLTDDISTNTIYILGMANVERALLSAIDKAEQSFQKNMSVENAQQLVALADTLKREITVGCDLVIKQVDHCERGNLNWNGILDLLSMIQKEKFNIGATIKWIFGDKDSSYAKVRKDIISIKKSVELADFYAGSVSVLEFLREVKSTTPSAWASGEVKKAVNYGILPEWMRNNYQNNLTRIEFCALLEYMIEGKTGKTALQLANELAQVQGGHFKAPFDDALYMEVNDIARLGIISGVGNNLFNPLGEITRQEAATMLYRTANVLGYDTSSNAISFSDVATWATKGVSYVTTKGIMVGTSNGFDPGGKYTKEQAILTMVRFYENVF